MRVKLTGRWAEARKALQGAAARMSAAIRRSPEEEAGILADEIRRGLRTGAPGGTPLQPLSPVTQAIRDMTGTGGRQPLYDTGRLAGSVLVKEAGPGRWFVGFPPGEVSAVAAIQEFGAGPIVLSEEARQFVLAAMRQAGLLDNTGEAGSGAAMVVVIPPRPFIRPAAEAYARRRGRILDRVADRVMGMLGWGIRRAPPVRVGDREIEV